MNGNGTWRGMPRNRNGVEKFVFFSFGFVMWFIFTRFTIVFYFIRKRNALPTSAQILHSTCPCPCVCVWVLMRMCSVERVCVNLSMFERWTCKMAANDGGRRRHGAGMKSFRCVPSHFGLVLLIAIRSSFQMESNSSNWSSMAEMEFSRCSECCRVHLRLFLRIERAFYVKLFISFDLKM